MHRTVSFRTIPRTLRFRFRSLVKSRTSTGQGLVKADKEFCILESTFGDVSYPQSYSSACSPPATDLTCPSSTSGTALTIPYSLLVRDSPLASLERTLLCTAQRIAVQPEEPQVAVLRTATKATVVQIDEPIAAEAQVAIIDIDADAHSPSISITPPTLKKNTSKADHKSVVAPLLPLQNITGIAGTLRPSGSWDGKKTLRNTTEELMKEYIPRAYPSRPLFHRRGAFSSRRVVCGTRCSI
ncbi:hypothetical protein BDZ89DRAFT_1169271 [Hymenopellis radicata]|nr:hypothetical protein BDZ89DRAFT_1169271 [Hymenopellis radicata]